MEEEVEHGGIELWEQDDRAGRRERHQRSLKDKQENRGKTGRSSYSGSNTESREYGEIVDRSRPRPRSGRSKPGPLFSA